MKIELPKITPSEAGTIILQKDDYKMQNILHYANIAISRAYLVVAICEAFAIPYDEDKIKEYSTDFNKLKNQYIELELSKVEEAIKVSDLFREVLKEKASEVFESYVTVNSIPAGKNCDIGNFEFLVWNAETKAFELDRKKAEESCVVYLDEEGTKVYDKHRLVAALLTDLLAGSITHISHIAQYFDLADDGTIRPSFGDVFTEYPPKGLNKSNGC